MALLNPPQILPNVLRVLVRTLQGADGFTMSVDDLAHLAAPAALASNADAGDGSKGFGDTLTACAAMGITSRGGGTVALSEELSWLRDRQLSDEHLRMHLADRIFDASLNEGLWTSSEGARDLTRALSWHLLQDPLRPPRGWSDGPDGVDAVELRQFSTEDRVFSNDTRWGAFQRWSKFLGFGRDLPHMLSDGRTLKTVLVPDPTDAFRRVLTDVIDTQPQEIFVLIDRLRRRLPVLDGGTYCQQVSERMRQNSEPKSEVIAPAVAHALRRLELDGMIVLTNLADAPRRMSMVDESDTGRTVSHAALAPARGGTRG
jgi:hypothetical protein